MKSSLELVSKLVCLSIRIIFVRFFFERCFKLFGKIER